MIVLDTNVVSELVADRPAAQVAAWVDSMPRREVFITAITKAEMLFGLAIMPVGRRRAAKTAAVQHMLENVFDRRVLAFDSDAAGHFADITAIRQKIGHPISTFDAQIAAVARSRRMSVGTRNGEDFTDCGLTVVNPWDYAP